MSEVKEAEMARLLVAALHEVRLILGPGRPEGGPEQAAAAVAYALHNQALAFLAGRPTDMDVAWSNLRAVDRRFGAHVIDEY